MFAIIFHEIVNNLTSSNNNIDLLKMYNKILIFLGNNV